MTKKQKAKLGLFLLPAGALFCLIVLYMTLVWPIYKVIQSRDWPQVECVIDSYQVKEAGLHQSKLGNKVQYQVDVQYSYVFGGKHYVSTLVSFNDGLLYTTKLPSRIPKFKTCYVNPDNPSEAVCIRHYNYFLLLLSALPALLLGVCLYALYWCRKTLQKQPGS